MRKGWESKIGDLDFTDLMGAQAFLRALELMLAGKWVSEAEQKLQDLDHVRHDVAAGDTASLRPPTAAQGPLGPELWDS